MNRYARFITVLWLGLTACHHALAVDYTGADKRDPFKSLAPTAPKQPERPLVPEPMVDRRLYQLQGIIWNPNRPQIILNGTICKEGDMVNEAKVIKIEPNKVRLSVRNQEFDLSNHAL